MAHTQTTSTYADTGRAIRWQDWANAILAIWLFISPWVIGFGNAGAATTGAAGTAAAAGGEFGGTASWNAWVLGVIVFLVAVSAMGRRFVMSQEWVNLVLGIWIFVAPWVLGFVSLGSAAWDHWIVGALIFLVSLSIVLMGRSLAVAPPPPPPPMAPGV
jgi:hypothetical protein